MTKDQIVEALRQLKAEPEMHPAPSGSLTDGWEMFVKLGERWETLTNIRRMLSENEELLDELVDEDVPMDWVFSQWGERVDIGSEHDG